MVGIFTSLALDGGPSPLSVIALRSGAVGIILAIYLTLVGVPKSLPVRDAAVTIGIGLVMSINNIALTSAIHRIPVPLAVMLFYIWPALVAIGGAMLGHEKVSPRTLVGLALSFVGIALALQVKFSDAEIVGVLFALLAAVSWTASVLLMGQFLPRRDSRTYTYWITCTSAAVFITSCLVTADFASPVSTRGWVGLIGLPIWYAIGIIGFYVASATIGATKTSFYMNFEPIAAVLLAAMILGQSLAPIQLLGAALVVGALFLFRSAH